MTPERTRSRLLPLAALAVLLLSTVAAPVPADASPWTVPDDELTILLSADFVFADEEYLPGGQRQAFPLDGEFVASQLTTTLRYGFSDRFEGGVVVRPKAVFYRADPIILPKGTDTPNESILNFTHQRYGVGDLDLFARWKLYDGPVVVTSQTVFNVPTGYEPPDGTFRDDALDVTAIEDDVALGDGLASVEQRFLAGAFVPWTRSFARADVGYRLRIGAGDQLVGGLKIGQLIGDAAIVFASVDGAYTVYEGPSIGKSFVAVDPSVPPAQFTADDVRPVDLTLDRTFLNVRGGVILRLDGAELQLAYGRTVAGRNIPVMNMVSVGTSVRVPNVSGDSK